MVAEQLRAFQPTPVPHPTDPVAPLDQPLMISPTKHPQVVRLLAQQHILAALRNCPATWIAKLDSKATWAALVDPKKHVKGEPW